jgi:polysaccharide pyruvyl transferase WcaK-like protein
MPVDYETAPAAAAQEPASATAGKCRIVFFGVFGVQNIGNECTLQAIVQNARKRLPGSEFSAVSYKTEDTVERHQMPAIPVSQQNFAGVKRRGGLRGRFEKLLRVCLRVPGELNDWLSARRALRGADLLVMTGTGMLTDYMTTATGFPYDIFRWTGAARLAGCKVAFVGVGAGPIYGNLSKRLLRRALSRAEFRSYRDENTRDRIRKIGFRNDKDYVFPDLAWSLDPAMFPQRANRKRTVRQVGLGVMDHRDIHLWTPEEHEARYENYLNTMCEFVVWLVEHNYAVRILQGDAKNDATTRAELKARLEKRGISYEKSGIIDEGAKGVDDLIAQIGECDIVVSPRFHNLLLGLMMNIPAVSISYDPKTDFLLEGVGLGKYCQPLEEVELPKLIDHFTEVEARADQFKPLIAEKAKEYRTLLDEEYDLLFGELERRSR